jgi:hypothetical protein
MIDALVNDGDLVILSAAQEVYNGDMVAARVTGDDGQEATTLKHFYRENGHVRQLWLSRRRMQWAWECGKGTIRGCRRCVRRWFL